MKCVTKVLIVLAVLTVGYAAKKCAATEVSEPFSLSDESPKVVEVPNPQALSDWLTVSANVIASFDKTNFYQRDHDTMLATIDSRIEYWPLGRDIFAIGPYARLAGDFSDRNIYFENVWLAEPGSAGLQCYPTSLECLRDTFIGQYFPVRLFGEYDLVHYLGSANVWRPNRNIRAGAEVWIARNVNDNSQAFWWEAYGALIWQSTQEFDETEVICAQSVRAGVRLPNSGWVSSITPYLAISNLVNDHPVEFYNNNLTVGAGIRMTPDLTNLPPELNFLNRAFLFAEYDVRPRYWDRRAPTMDIAATSVYPFTPATPSYDLNIGLTFAFGPWWQ